MVSQTAPTVEVKASVKYLHTSPYKVRAVLDLIRGMAAEDAERVLQLTERDAADDILKVLESAMANAEHNNQLPADELYITRCYADEGPTRPGGRARARGRSFKIRKRTSHIMIVLARYSETELEARRRKAEAAPTARGGSQRKRSERVRASRQEHVAEHDHDHDHDHGHEEIVDAPTAVASVQAEPTETVDVDEATEQVNEETE